ncbi:jg17976 [Pararge aegeria aegeria]|uniref:RNA helicase n=2 Tax=Pararge aegeria TaxID=116150 RepID=A0A8S4RZC8_9NEOP|nr:jg17976 [Pararge aegeria aegeria]
MALKIAKSFMRRNDLVKLFYQDGKQLLQSKTYVLTVSTNRSTFFGTYARKQNNLKFGKQILCNRFYSVKTAEESDAEYYKEHNITIVGEDIPSPFKDIDNSYFPEYIKQFLDAQGFTKPTVIQAQGWPIAISGKNFVGIAQTGTGKTLAYLLPAVIQLKEKEGRKGRGPRVLILAPTRELARQIEEVAKEFQKLFNLRCLCIYGGVSRIPQMEALKNGVDILIATPGRLNDFLDSKVTNLSRCGYVVLDEADRMLDMGFEPQIRKALEDVPLERQILMFSATWPKEVQYLAKDYLGEFVQVNVGSTELSANHNIKQHIHVCEQEEKMAKFKSIMHEMSGEGFGKVLVFTNTKRFVDSLTLTLKRNGWPAVGIHGDKSQQQRDVTINKFRSGSTNVLVATDVAARGLDVDGVTHVINYDFPNTSEDYIHRIGRTGRLQNKGVAHTILTTEDARQARSLIAVLKEANQEIPKELEDLARDYRSMKISDKQPRYSPKKPTWATKKWNNFRSDRYSRY